jgi:urease gamma subunit
MNLTPREKDKLTIALAAIVARVRLTRGIKLNYPESIALITDFVLEGAREGRSVAELNLRCRQSTDTRSGHGRYFRNDSRDAGGGYVSGWH